jgi:hypothetical protein
MESSLKRPQSAKRLGADAHRRGVELLPGFPASDLVKLPIGLGPPDPADDVIVGTG